MLWQIPLKKSAGRRSSEWGVHREKQWVVFYIYFHTKICERMYVAALFKIAKNWKQLNIYIKE